MSEDITALQAQWNEAIEAENSYQVEQLVREILRNHPDTSLASEIRYKRGVITLMEGEGYGSERMARALNEFQEGLKSAEVIGEDAEPWRSLNRTQIAICHARRNNIDGAVNELKSVIAYKPKSANGLGAYVLITEILEQNDRAKDAKRFQSQRLSYARALVRENPDSEELNAYRFLLAQELLNTTYAKEGESILQELLDMDEETLGTDLMEDLQAFVEASNPTAG